MILLKGALVELKVKIFCWKNDSFKRLGEQTGEATCTTNGSLGWGNTPTTGQFLRFFFFFVKKMESFYRHQFFVFKTI